MVSYSRASLYFCSYLPSVFRAFIDGAAKRDKNRQKNLACKKFLSYATNEKLTGFSSIYNSILSCKLRYTSHCFALTKSLYEASSQIPQFKRLNSILMDMLNHMLAHNNNHCQLYKKYIVITIATVCI